MPKEYTPEEYRKLYEKLPEEIKEMLFSDEASDTIYNACERNGIPEEKAVEISKYVGDVLVGLLPPNEFQETLEKELGIETEKAKMVSREITRYIFFPVKGSLEELYKIEVTPAGVAPTTAPKPAPPRPEVRPAEKREEKPTEKEKPVTDVYREPIE
jgi:hypothetical protein